MTFKTYNDLMQRMTDYDYVVGLRKGECVYLKNRYDEADVVEITDVIQLVLHYIPETGIKLFDEGVKEELLSAIRDIFAKHNINT